MKRLNFKIEINASKQKVWETMLEDETYRVWTATFHPGSYFEGEWKKGSKMLFLAEDDGKLSGMSSQILEAKPYDYVSIEHLGEVVDGVEDTTSERVKKWQGAQENYILDEVDGVTTLTIELDEDHENKEMMEMLNNMWPPALNKLKELCEQSNS